MKLGTIGRAAFALAVSLTAIGATAQTAGAPAGTGLSVPANAQFLGNANPAIRTATAIVNGSVITGTDIDHRVALIALAGNVEIPAEELQIIRAQVLRNLVDETLQIQAAEQRDLKVDPAEIDSYYERFARNFGHTPQSFGAYLRTVGSSEQSIKRQIHGELAWQRLQRRQIEPFVSVGEEEVQQIINRLNASRGTREYRVAEIFLSATPETAAETRSNATRIVEQIRNGASFVAYARQFSEASTAAVGGDLGWVRAEQLPDELAQVVRQIPVGAVSEPIEIPGGYSIVALTDARQILMPDARDAVLSLKQISLDFAPGTTRNQAAPRVEALARLGQTMGGCGRAEQGAAAIGATVISRDDIRVRDLPPALQEAILGLNIGQSTQPYGSFEEGVRILVLCGRDDPQDATAPTFEQLYMQITEDRVNRRAQRLLRDLRRDAVVEYR